MLHDKTKIKVKTLLDMGIRFCKTQEEKYKNAPDVSFMTNAFVNIFTDFNFKFGFKKDYGETNFHNDIYDFDNIMSSWQENLIYRLPCDEENQNNLYGVLFSILQGISSILAEDHFNWEEDKHTIAEESGTSSSLSGEHDLDVKIEQSADDDKDYLHEREALMK